MRNSENDTHTHMREKISNELLAYITRKSCIEKSQLWVLIVVIVIYITACGARNMNVNEWEQKENLHE